MHPDIVVLMADQMIAHGIGALGHPVVETPNIDRLVKNGVTFTNTYCNSPICASARTSFMAGKLVRETGVYDNGSEFSADVPTFAHHLRRAGYETVLSGKMHFVGPDQLHGFELRLIKDIHAPGFDLTPDWTKGVYPNYGTSVSRLKNPGITETNNNLRYDDEVLRLTLEQIRTFNEQQDRRPFFLCASFFHPHDPFEITEKYWRPYEHAEVPLPDAPREATGTMHPFNQWIQRHHEADVYELTDEQIRNNRRAYYGMISYFDDKVGEIVAELEKSDRWDDTVIIVTSDHGEMLGEHGMWFKRTFYDPAAKVPLVVSQPKQFLSDKICTEVVSLVDVAATLMKIGDVPDADRWIAGMDGDSFHELLSGEDCVWKNEAWVEYYGEGPIQPLVMWRDGRYKYVYVHECEPLLFDLEKDPHELHNLARQPEYREQVDAFLERIAQEYDMEKLREEILRDQQSRKLIHDALQIGKKTSWDHDPGW